MRKIVKRWNVSSRESVQLELALNQQIRIEKSRKSGIAISLITAGVVSLVVATAIHTHALIVIAPASIALIGYSLLVLK